MMWSSKWTGGAEDAHNMKVPKAIAPAKATKTCPPEISIAEAALGLKDVSVVPFVGACTSPSVTCVTRETVVAAAMAETMVEPAVGACTCPSIT